MVKAATPATTDKIDLTLKSGDKTLSFEFFFDLGNSTYLICFNLFFTTFLQLFYNNF
jgi:hypothetical protein